jgi:hypothetical protein
MKFFKTRECIIWEDCIMTSADNFLGATDGDLQGGEGQADNQGESDDLGKQVDKKNRSVPLPLGSSFTVDGVTLALVVLVVVAFSFFVPRQLYFVFDINKEKISTLRNSVVKITSNLVNLKSESLLLERRQKTEKSSLTASEENIFLTLSQLPISPYIKRDRPPITLLTEEMIQNTPPKELTKTVNGLTGELERARIYGSEITDFKRELINRSSDRLQIQQALSKITLQLEQTNNAIKAAAEEHKHQSQQLMELSKESETMYHVVRAFSLGALGAFGAMAARRTSKEGAGHRIFVGWAVLSMFFSGLVTLAVFGLLTTREISIFSENVVAPNLVPDYWRTLIVCLAAGAFSDRLFSAARDRIDGMTGSQNGNI